MDVVEEEGERGGGGDVIKRVMGWKRRAVTSYCRLRGGKGIGRWWENKVGHVDNATCRPKCEREDQTPEHNVFRCKKIKRLKDIRDRREWARVDGMGWDSWDALASKKWVRMEDTG